MNDHQPDEAAMLLAMMGIEEQRPASSRPSSSSSGVVKPSSVWTIQGQLVRKKKRVDRLVLSIKQEQTSDAHDRHHMHQDDGEETERLRPEVLSEGQNVVFVSLDRSHEYCFLYLYAVLRLEVRSIPRGSEDKGPDSSTKHPTNAHLEAIHIELVQCAPDRNAVVMALQGIGDGRFPLSVLGMRRPSSTSSSCTAPTGDETGTASVGNSTFVTTSISSSTTSTSTVIASRQEALDILQMDQHERSPRVKRVAIASLVRLLQGKEAYKPRRMRVPYIKQGDLELLQRLHREGTTCTGSSSDTAAVGGRVGGRWRLLEPKLVTTNNISSAATISIGTYQANRTATRTAFDASSCRGGERIMGPIHTENEASVLSSGLMVLQGQHISPHSDESALHSTTSCTVTAGAATRPPGGDRDECSSSALSTPLPHTMSVDQKGSNHHNDLASNHRLAGVSATNNRPWGGEEEDSTSTCTTSLLSQSSWTIIPLNLPGKQGLLGNIHDINNSSSSSSSSSAEDRVEYILSKKLPQVRWMTQRVRDLCNDDANNNDNNKSSDAPPPPPPRHIVDVGGGRGDLAAALAMAFPTTLITVIDKNQSSLHAAQDYARRLKCHERMQFLHADMVDFVQQPQPAQEEQRQDSAGDDDDVDDYETVITSVNDGCTPASTTVSSIVKEGQPPVDLVVALHACGDLSDLALAFAHLVGAAFVINPCCYTKRYSYPQFIPSWNKFCTEAKNHPVCSCCSELLPPGKKMDDPSCRQSSTTSAVHTLGRLAELNGRPEVSRLAMKVINSMRLQCMTETTSSSSTTTTSQQDEKKKCCYRVGLEEYESACSQRNIVLVGLRK